MKHFHKSAGRPENPQIFRPAQFFLFALKDAAADFNALDEKTPQRIFIALLRAGDPKAAGQHPVVGAVHFLQFAVQVDGHAG